LLTGCGGGDKKAAAPAAGGADKKIVIKCGTEAAASHPESKGAQKLAELVKAKSNGSIEIQVFDSAKLGSMKERCEGMRMGTVDMGTSSAGFLASYVPVMGLLIYRMFTRIRLMNSVSSMVISVNKLIRRCKRKVSVLSAILIWAPVRLPTT